MSDGGVSRKICGLLSTPVSRSVSNPMVTQATAFSEKKAGDSDRRVLQQN